MPPLRRLTDAERTRVRELLAALVRIDSAVASTEQACRDRTEERMAAFVTDHLREMGMVVDRQEVYPGRPNLTAHWPDQGRGRSLMLEAHLDTVTTEGMVIDPFAAEVRDGRMWGRGTCDTKGSMAAFLTALAIARESGQLPEDKLYFVATMSEETCCVGSSALMTTDFRTDAAIVGEPTGCRLVTAHKWPLWLEIETHGRACHASMPEEGVNAVQRMARVIEVIHGAWTEHIQRREHPLLGRSTAAVTRIEGGSKINILPASCRAQVDGRFIPGGSAEEVVQELSDMLAYRGFGPDAVTIRVLDRQSPMDCPPDHPLAGKLLALCREANGQSDPLGVNYFADSGPFSRAGITSVLFGPGDIAQAHTADEFLDLAQLDQATEIILNLLTQHAGRPILA